MTPAMQLSDLLMNELCDMYDAKRRIARVLATALDEEESVDADADPDAEPEASDEDDEDEFDDDDEDDDDEEVDAETEPGLSAEPRVRSKAR